MMVLFDAQQFIANKVEAWDEGPGEESESKSGDEQVTRQAMESNSIKNRAEKDEGKCHIKRQPTLNSKYVQRNTKLLQKHVFHLFLPSFYFVLVSLSLSRAK